MLSKRTSYKRTVVRLLSFSWFQHLSRREVAFSEEKVLWRSLEIQMDERNVSLKNELEIEVENGLQQKEKALNLEKMLDDSRKNEVTLKYKVST